MSDLEKYNELKKWIDSIKDIPKKVEYNRTIMDIMGIDHHETTWSQIYFYLFNTNENHGKGELFIKALLDVCGIDKDFFHDPYIITEYPCEDQKRIDILLVERNHALIIENKVYHVLNNDLEAYYKDVEKSFGCKDIKVVVLGLCKYDIDNYEKAKNIDESNKFSITHTDLMDKMYEVFKKNEIKEQWKFNFLFNEFYHNVKNMANKTVINELKFFEACNSDERLKIYQIASLYNNLISYLDKKMQMKELVIDGEKLIGKHENDYVKYVFDGTDNKMMLTVLYKNKLLVPDCKYSRPHILIVLELQGKYMTNVKTEDFESHFMDGKIKHSNECGDKWRHFAYYVQDIDIKEAFLDLKLSEYIKNSGLIALAHDIKNKIDELSHY